MSKVYGSSVRGELSPRYAFARSFRSFFRELWDRFAENRDDPEFKETLPFAIQTLERYADQNIETLLSVGSALDEGDKSRLKRAIRRGFERRNLGRILKVYGRHGKLAPYSRLLGLIESGDTVVSFNYDNALEIPLCLASRRFDALNTSELSSAQMKYLTDGRATARWIPTNALRNWRNERLSTYRPIASRLDRLQSLVAERSAFH